MIYSDQLMDSGKHLLVMASEVDQGDTAKGIIEGYEKEITKVDSDTRDDLIGIDIELGKMIALQGFGAGYSRLKVKEHITNITKRYREAVIALSAALTFVNIKNKKK